MLGVQRAITPISEASINTAQLDAMRPTPQPDRLVEKLIAVAHRWLCVLVVRSVA